MAKASKSKSHKYVYTWGNGKADGDGSMKPLLGGKGANLAEMTRIGLPVPPGFTITTDVCTYFLRAQENLPEGIAIADGSGHREHGKDHGHKVWRDERGAVARRRPLRRARFDAGHDGHDFESWSQ